MTTQDTKAEFVRGASPGRRRKEAQILCLQELHGPKSFRRCWCKLQSKPCNSTLPLDWTILVADNTNSVQTSLIKQATEIMGSSVWKSHGQCTCPHTSVLDSSGCFASGVAVITLLLCYKLRKCVARLRWWIMSISPHQVGSRSPVPSAFFFLVSFFRTALLSLFANHAFLGGH